MQTTSKPSEQDPFADPREAIPSCAATDQELQLQRERQTRLAPGVSEVKRRGSELIVSFHPGFDRHALVGMIETEQRCCPFFRFRFDEHKRELAVSVGEPEHEPALEALTAALGAGEAAAT
jgi:hypothetical protein